MRYIPVLLLMILLSLGKQSYADIAAGSLTYRWLSDSTYVFTCKLYIPCHTGNEPDSLTMCALNTCTNSSFTTTLHKWSGNVYPSGLANGSVLPPGCSPHPATTCTDTASKIPGKREWWYTDTVMLPARCSDWKFSINQSKRSTQNNYTGGNFYIETHFNNQLSLQNSSPAFTIPDVTYLCLNQPFTYKSYAVDTDGDSLVYKLKQTRIANSGACPYSDTTQGIKQSSPVINFRKVNGNPFQTNNTFNIDTSNGEIKFTTSQVGSNQMTLLIEEYRNGVLIGSVLRDVQFEVLSCSTIGPGPIITSNTYVDTNTLVGAKSYGSGLFVGCAGQKIEFDTYFIDTDSITRNYLEDSISKQLPGATITYYNQLSDSVHMHFTWTPTANDTGMNTFQLRITDSACRPPGIIVSYIKDYNIFIPQGVSAGADAAICTHEVMYLTANGGHQTDYVWRKLPGATGTLSCDTCRVSIVKPTSTSRYEVTSFADWCPSVYKDTIEVSVLPNAITYPLANIIAEPGNRVWPGLEVIFRAEVSDCKNLKFQWQKNDRDVDGATGMIWRTTDIRDGDEIKCIFTCGDTCPDPRITVTDSIIMTVTTDVAEITNKNKLQVYPNPNNGNFRIVLPESIRADAELQVINTLGQIINREKTHIDGESFQINLKDTPDGMYILSVKTNTAQYRTIITIKK